MNAILATLDTDAASRAVLLWIGQALLFGTVLTGVTWMLTRPLRRRAYAGFEAALWSIVLLKFLIPVGPGSSLSLASVCRSLSRHAPAEAILTRISGAVTCSCGTCSGLPERCCFSGRSLRG